MSTHTQIGPTRPPLSAVLAMTYTIVIIASGAYGLVHPAASVESGLGVATAVYSIGLIGMGAIAAVAVAWGWRRTELAALLTLAALTLLHSALVAYASGATGGQTALRLAAATVGLTGWALCRWDRGITRRQVDRHVHEALTKGSRSNG